MTPASFSTENAPPVVSVVTSMHTNAFAMTDAGLTNAMIGVRAIPAEADAGPRVAGR